MPATTFQQLLDAAFRQDGPTYLLPDDLKAYQTLHRSAPAEQGFRFERVRLLVAMSLMKALADLGDHEESRQVMEVLHKALGARSTQQIDSIITKDAHRFERLYTDLYVNEEGSLLLNLFERTLDADSIPAMDQVMEEALDLVSELDFNHQAEEDEDEDE
ncbi:hypothetical protein [Solirubrum puertoriconensis]|uniref:Uncharacterized protein n=1 Tax=Solirubrum puertoriconensis TaxID=1751427 RepID=A0A9X0HJ39_SOLP1|nr:hypothetical protein [Solirubrum puertoriconensis]KUG06806.1 hypothetical protein ASU33_05610 [Solirubrum puertoriconensis]